MTRDEKSRGWALIPLLFLGWQMMLSLAHAFERMLRPSRTESALDSDTLHLADSVADLVSAASPPPDRSRQPPDRTAAALQVTGRGADRNLDAEAGVDLIKRERWGTLIVTVSLALAFTGGIGFLIAYWSDGSNVLMGGTLALFFGGLGVALVVWSHLLTANKEAIEPREPLSHPTTDFEPAINDFRLGESDVRRRGLLISAAAAGSAIIGAVFISMLRSLAFAPGSDLYTRVWKRGQRLVTADGHPVTVDSLQPGSTTIVFPEDSIGSERSQTVLLRVHQDLLQLPRERSRWAPMGNLAYSRVCTHAGCTVGMYEATTHLLMCPCHQSTFNVLDGAQPTGGPAARALPQLPLYADSQGFLHAAGGFTEPPGPGFWEMP